MKFTIFFAALLLFSCNNQSGEVTKTTDESISKDPVETTTILEPKNVMVEEFFNERFRKVKVVNLGENIYKVSGEAQIFEANFSWVVEDGHYVLKSGYEMTDAGAPEWGKFDFTLKVEKKNEYSTLHLILFETSAKDGSRQSELLMPLD